MPVPDRGAARPRAQAGDDALDAVVGGAVAGSNETTLPSSSISAPQTSSSGRRSTVRPKVTSSRSSSSPGSRPRAGAGAREASSPRREGAQVPRTRTEMGVAACRRALVTSSETPSSALDEIGAADVVAGLDHPAACILHAAGARPKDRAGLLNGTVVSTGWGKGCLSERLPRPRSSRRTETSGPAGVGIGRIPGGLVNRRCRAENVLHPDPPVRRDPPPQERLDRWRGSPRRTPADTRS